LFHYDYLSLQEGLGKYTSIYFLYIFPEEYLIQSMIIFFVRFLNTIQGADLMVYVRYHMNPLEIKDELILWFLIFDEKY